MSSSLIKRYLRPLDLLYLVTILALAYKVHSLSQRAMQPEMLVVRGIKIVDSKGQTRVVLGEEDYQTRWTTHTQPQPTHGLFLYGYDGRRTACFVSDTSIGGPELQLLGSEPDQIATITSNLDGDVGLQFRKKGASAVLEVHGNFQFPDSASLLLLRRQDEISASLFEEGPQIELSKGSARIWSTSK